MDHIVDVTGRIELKSDNGERKPRMILADVGMVGVPVHRTYTQPGFGVVGKSQGGAPFFVNFVNDGDNNEHANGRALTMRIMGRSNDADIGGADNGIECLVARGTFLNPTASLEGDKLFKLTGFGHATNEYCQNESVAIVFTADEDFENTGSTPLGSNTKAGGAMSIETCDLGSNFQKIRVVVDSKGNLAVGEFERSGNNFPGKGLVILKNAVEPPTAAVNGCGVLYPQGGYPHWRASGAQQNQNIPLRSLENLPQAGEVAIWANDHELKSGGVLGAARAMASWNASGSGINASNVSNITKNGTGDFTITFSNAFSNANAFFPMFWGQGRYQYAGRDSSWVRVQSFDASGNFKDFDVNYMVVFA